MEPVEHATTETRGNEPADRRESWIVLRVALITACLLVPAASAGAQSDATPLERAAWTAVVLDRPNDAIDACVALLDRLPSGPRRDEALVVLAGVLADVDWDRDDRADDATPLDRMSALVPLDRPWSGELAWLTAHALFVSSRDAEAIAVFEWASTRWPAPEGGTSMAAACRRHRARPETLHRESAITRTAASATCARHGL